MIGADTDIPALRALFGSQRAGAVTIAQALHWMNHDELFQAAIPLLRPGGGIAVITNGTRKTPPGPGRCAASWTSGSAQRPPPLAALMPPASGATATA
jgi:hypothetical protein